jgi:sarcosine oxidase subunit beta
MNGPASRPAPHGTAVGSEADVVIIGGGVMGASIAYHLAEAGVRDIVVLEQGELAGGSSGKPIGGVRAQFSDPVNIALGARSLRAYQDFGRRPGADIKLDSVGYLFLLTEKAHVAAFETSVALQQEFGVPSRFISAREAQQLCPYVVPDGLLAAVYSPTDGHARPGLAVRGYVAAATRRGVVFATGTRVTGLATTGDRVTAVHTDRGDIRCRTVICAAGAWSAAVGAMAGVDLPVRPVRRQLAFTAPLAPPAPRIPFTIDFASTAYFHNSDDGLLLGIADPDQADGFDVTWTADWLDLFRAAVAQRAPALVDLPIASGWAGLYEVTPGHNALIGRSTTIGNFLYATGFSGHGFLQAPAVGEVVRDLVLQQPPVIDVAALHADRFLSSATIRPEAAVV